MKAGKISWFRMIAVVLALCGMVLLPQAAALAGGKSFSADQVTITPDGKEITGKIYVHEDKFRMEMEQPGMPGKMIVLYSKDDKAVTMLMKMSKRYFVIPADESQYASYDPEEAMQKKKLGTETVNGIKCTKYEVVNEVKGMMGGSQKVKSIVWKSDDFLVPVKSQTERMTQELRNIKVGSVPAKMFKVPTGYKEAGNMMELMMPAQ